MRIHPAATPAPKSAPKQSQAAKQKPKTTNAYASSNQKHDEQKAPQRTADTPSDVLANAAAETKRDKGVYASMKRAFSPYVENHSHAVLYGIIGFVAAALILIVGFWPTVLLAVFAAIGVVIGKYRDGDRKTRQQMNRSSNVSTSETPRVPRPSPCEIRAARGVRPPRSIMLQKGTTMTQSTMTKPATSSTYNPYSDMDADKKKSDAATADSVSAEPVYKLVIDENVVEKISSMAAQKIDGIIDMKGNVLSRIQEGLGGADKTKGVDADIVDDTNAKINLDVIMEYGKSAPEIFDDIKKVVGGDLKDMTGLNVVEMTVNVVDVMTPEEYAQKNGSNSDDGQQDDSAN